MSMPNTIITLLKHNYPQAKCSLNFEGPFELLIATILSAQCTDERVNMVTKDLFQKYKSAKYFAESDLSELEQDIKSTGFFRAKAKNIKKSAQMIVNNFDGKLPDSMDNLLKLAGVARKTANVVLYNGFGKSEGIAVDTHVSRISQRLGLTKNKEPENIERDLMKIVPKSDWGYITHVMIDHGRAICKSRKPLCAKCPLRNTCPSFALFTNI